MVTMLGWLVYSWLNLSSFNCRVQPLGGNASTYMCGSWEPRVAESLCCVYASLNVSASVQVLPSAFCMTKPACLSVCCLGICLSEACADFHLVLCCLKTMGLKISPRALALSRFLVQFWHTFEKCLIRQWMVSQYCGGRLGVLAMWRRSWAHSSGFTTSVKKKKKKERTKDGAFKLS